MGFPLFYTCMDGETCQQKENTREVQSEHCQEACPEGSADGLLYGLWDSHRQVGAASSGHREAAGCDRTVSKVPPQARPGIRESTHCQDMEVRLLRQGGEPEVQNLLSGMPIDARQVECNEAMGGTRTDKEVQTLRQDVSVRPATADDMQPLMRESHGMEEEIRRAMSDRTKRLGRLGNAVVPACAE